ncbi:hypothetical protein HLA87_02650 [Mycoplasma miroungigenitalium]|uniref:DUF31 domain-containing protein n=1 Tax=Mycoplasma miroungigenitalium TaxID=754515 RepID=A0A6M4J9Q0_9MOLU|nr:DUF31 family protein [Mycoplasma miroungigenitalium]QJR43673.1 hypothetical protein HLA87_02650 [Mycoplasma miroungigenitalium]
MTKNKLILLTANGLLLPIIASSSACKTNSSKSKDTEIKNDKENNAPVDNSISTGSNNNNTNTNDTSTGTSTMLGSDSINSIRKLGFDELFDLKLIHFGVEKNKKDFTPQTIEKNYEEIVQLELKNKFRNNITAQLTAVTTEWNANLTGKLKITVLFADKNDTSFTFINSFELSGFKTTDGGVNDDGTFPENPNLNTISNFDKYAQANQLERFQIDNTEYMKGLKNQYQGQSIEQLRPELNYTAIAAQKFNEKAKLANINSYEDSVYKGYTLPKLNNDGSFNGLSIFSGSVPAKHSTIDFLGDRNVYQSIGLARLLPNEFYKQIGLETLAVGFNYTDTFIDEISKAQHSIDLLTKWKSENELERLKEYKDAAIDQKKTELTLLNYDEERELNIAYEADKAAIRKNFQEARAKINQEINKIQNYTFDDVIAIFNKEIKEYQIELKLNRKFRGANGTMWIMDYEIPTGAKKYPTKWYFGTNSHVAKLMSSSTFNGFDVTVLSPETGIKSVLKLTGLDERFTNYSFSGSDVQKGVTKIYDAVDYLTTSPSKYLSDTDKAKYKDVEEMIDFAIIEIDFEKITSNNQNIQSSVTSNNVMLNSNILANAEDLAKAITNNYYAREDKNKTKFLPKSYLHNYEQIDYPFRKKGSKDKNTDELFALGYPMAREDFFLRRYYDDDQIKWKETYQSLWTNSDYRFYNASNVSEGGKANISEERYKRGNFLSYQIGYRSFIDKPGINDGFIVSPIRGKEIYKTYDETKTKLKSYFNSGLQYMLRHFVPVGGSSGSSVRNQNNELVGVHSTIIQSAKTDFVAAFRSEGYDYKGAYGEYNLPQYDLIYGGGKEQKTSYLDSLINKYGENGIHTWLFKNGASKSNIPSQFLFNNTENELNK